MTDNPYRPPATDFSKPIMSANNPQAGGNLQDGIEGNYDFNIMEVLNEAWQKTADSTTTIMSASLIVFFIVFAVDLGIIWLLVLLSANERGILLSLIHEIIFTATISPFLAGVMMLGIRRAADLPINLAMAFSYFERVIPIAIAAVLVSILTTIGFILLIIPGIYLTMGYIMVIPLIVEKKLSPWQALESSRQAIFHHWFKIFFTYTLMLIICIISILPLGLGLMWTMTMMVNLNGILYRIIFGVEAARQLPQSPTS